MQDIIENLYSSERAVELKNRLEEILNEEYIRKMAIGLGYKEKIIETRRIENDEGVSMVDEEIQNPESPCLFLAYEFLGSVIQKGYEGFENYMRMEEKKQFFEDLKEIL